MLSVVTRRSSVHVQHDTNKTTFFFVKASRFLPLKACFLFPSVDLGLDLSPELFYGSGR